MTTRVFSRSPVPSHFVNPFTQKTLGSQDSKAQSIRENALKNPPEQKIQRNTLLNWKAGAALGAAGLATVAAISLSRYFSGIPQPVVPPVVTQPVVPPVVTQPVVPPVVTHIEVPPPPIPQNCRALISNINDFSRDLISRLPDPESAWVSPPTLTAVVGMLLAGMSSEDQVKSGALLQLPASMNSSDWISCLGSIAQQSAAINEIVLNKDCLSLSVKKSFLDLTNSYKTEIKSEDSGDDLILRSKNEFKGQWHFPFDAQATAKSDFDCGGNVKVNVSMMRKTDSFSYYEGTDFKMIEILYKEKNGQVLKKIIFLPNRPDELGVLESRLTDDFIKTCMKAAKTQSVDLMIPKLSIGKNYEIKDLLRSMGLSTSLFPEIANEPLPLMLTKVIHETTLQDGEEESVATSKTEAQFRCMAGPSSQFSEPEKPIPFHADHSFHHLIIDESGLILFRGNVKDGSAFQR